MFPGLRAAHAVAHREGKIHVAGRGLADFSQVMNFAGVKLQPQEGVLVVGPDFAAVGAAGPLQGFRRRGFGDEISMAVRVYSKPGRMVASSKSTTQKRPSDCR